MSKFKIALIIDFLFSRAIIFVLSFLWSRYYIRSLGWAIFAAAAITAGVSVILWFFTRKRREKNKRILERDKKSADAAHEFNFRGLDFTLNTIETALKQKYAVSRKDGFLIVETAAYTTCLFPHLSMQKLTPEELRRYFVAALPFLPAPGSESPAGKIIVLSFSGYTPAAAALAAQEKHIALTALASDAAAFSLLEEWNAVPEITLAAPQKKRVPLSAMFKVFFSKNRVKGYLFAAGALTLSSFIIPYSLYYIVAASLMLAFAALSFFSPKLFNLQKENELAL